MHLVDDVHLIRAPLRSENRTVAELADIIDAVV